MSTTGGVQPHRVNFNRDIYIYIYIFLQHTHTHAETHPHKSMKISEAYVTYMFLDLDPFFFAARQGMSPENCLLEFGHLLQMGSDLVGSQRRPLIPDCHITASSCHLNHPEHGFGQMWRSRLDNDQSCWIASDKDENPWLQWRFPSRREIRAIATKGNPNAAFWAGNSAHEGTDKGMLLKKHA